MNIQDHEHSSDLPSWLMVSENSILSTSLVPGRVDLILELFLILSEYNGSV